jgi:hypothetical protein
MRLVGALGGHDDLMRKTIEGVSNMTTIQSMRVIDVRFPTSQRLDGSDGHRHVACEERERRTPQRFSSGRDDLAPRTHGRGA